MYCIGLVGQNGSGKSSIAKFFIERLTTEGLTVETLKFSAVISETLQLWSLDNKGQICKNCPR